MEENSFKNLLKEKIKEYINIELNDIQLDKFFIYKEFLVNENKKYNLTRIVNDEDIIYKHFIDSLYILKYEQYRRIFFDKKIKILDVGTGAGFPGVPIAIVCNNNEYTLIDAINKKTNFLINLIDIIKLTKIEIINGRIEEYGQKVYNREKYDIVLTRAVGKLNILSEYTVPLVKNKGFCIYYKNEKIEEELLESNEAFTILGNCNVSILKYEKKLVDENYNHIFIIAKKNQITNKKFPRKNNIILKNPL